MPLAPALACLKVTFVDGKPGFESVRLEVRDWNGTARVEYMLSPSESGMGTQARAAEGRVTGVRVSLARRRLATHAQPANRTRLSTRGRGGGGGSPPPLVGSAGIGVENSTGLTGRSANDAVAAAFGVALAVFFRGPCDRSLKPGVNAVTRDGSNPHDRLRP